MTHSDCGGHIAPMKRKGNLFIMLRRSPVKVPAVIALILTVLLVGLMFASCYYAMGKTVEKVPAVAVFLRASGWDQEFSQKKAELQQTMGEIEASFTKYEMLLRRELTVEQFNTLEGIVDTAGDCSEVASVQNARKGVRLAQEFMSQLTRPLSYYEETYRMDMDIMSLYMLTNKIEPLLGLAAYTLMVGALMCAVFTAFGGVFRKKGLVIAGMILHLLYCLVLVGVAFALLSLALHIALLVFLGQLGKNCTLSEDPA